MDDVFETLNEPLKRALRAANFKQPTDIQKEAIPQIIVGSDVLGIAQTGTGKTAAFVLPMLERILNEPKRGIRSLILCPTRELAVQVAEHIQSFAKYTGIKHLAIYGGVGQGPQVNKLKRGVDLLVATPGRLFDLLDQGHVDLKSVDFFVLDEADRMLDMGFIHDIRKISTYLPKDRQTLFFSATMSGDISKLANSLLRKPVRIEVAPQATPVEKIEQRVLFVDHENKVDLLLLLLQREHLNKVLIFTKTKRGADRLCKLLKNRQVSAQQIHGDRTQSQRTQALKQFTTGKVRCLVATDVAARGIDIDDISHVINYDLPREAENYVHRIGRTARAGAEGTAYSFCTSDDKGLLVAIHKSIGNDLPIMNHKYHSDTAKDARPKPPVRFANRGRPSERRGAGKGGRGGPRTFGAKRGRKGKFASRSTTPKSSRGGRGGAASRRGSEGRGGHKPRGESGQSGSKKTPRKTFRPKNRR